MRATHSLPLCLITALFACSPRPGALKPEQPSQRGVPPANGSFAPGSSGSLDRASGPAAPDRSSGPAAAAPRVADLASSEPRFGAPVVAGRLAVYPITLAAQVDPGPIILLEDALAQGLAEVREVGTDAQSAPGVPSGVDIPSGGRQRREQRQEVQEQVLNSGGGGGATVNTLVIENKGDVPIYVLAGTVVKGGNQDRQIGQDFLVDARSTVPVDAFCVERGRWNGTRDGAGTAGKFEVATAALATSKVRAAGQYQKDQGAVWAEVSVANAAHDKKAPSDTLLATLDDEEVAARTGALATRIDAALGAPGTREELVGFAYAIDGEVRSVRWFSHHRLFRLARAKLVRTAAVDALTAEAAAAQAGDAAPAVAPPAAEAVAAFVAEVEAATEVDTRETGALNDNVYKQSARAWGSKTVRKAKAGESPAKAAPMSFDYIGR